MENEERLKAALADRYRIEREIGEGGMATVYLAEDLKHSRRVALKVLKPELAAVVGAERFLSEIETTANLTHPHILPLHDSGEADGFLFYVMPYVEGESLRVRLDREHQLPVEEAVRIASDLAEAVDYAHRRGVIHRDIKPANVLIQEGRPLIADFGIALAVGAAGGARLTETGLSLGTPYYMSPEQATGDEVVGPATDIYALACVLYEMLVGQPPYVGATAQAVLGKIISGGPVYAKRERGSVPANVDAAIRKAVEKLPADRFPSAKGFSAALADSTFRHGERVDVPVGRWRQLTVATVGLVAGLALAFGWMLTHPDPEVPTTRLSVHFASDQVVLGRFDISRDGSFMVYTGPGETEGERALWIRRWDALEATRIPGTNGVYPPAISPDGDEVAFFYGTGVIRVVPLQGGVARDIGGDAQPSSILRWGPEGRWIYFQTRGANTLNRIDADGGLVETLANFDSINSGSMWFDILPSGRGAVIELTMPDGAAIYALDLETGQHEVLSAGQFPRYANGYLFFGSPDGSTLMRAPFDPDRMEMTAPPVPVAGGLIAPSSGWNFFAASQTGRLLYETGVTPEVDHDVVWVTREGEVLPIDPDWTFNPGSNNRGLSLSPDGTRLAVTIQDDTNYDIWIKDLPRGPQTRLTIDPRLDVRPRWTPDGQAVTFLSDRGESLQEPAVYSKRGSAIGEAVRIMDHDLPLWEAVYSPDQSWLLGRTGGTTTVPGGRDVWALRPDSSDAAIPLVVTDFDEKAISLSPDGRFLLYESDQTTRNEVYVQTFPDVEEGRWTVSTAGGVMPVWSHGGNEIFYIDAQNRMTVASVETDPTFRVTDRTTLFELPEDILFRQGEQYPLYDVTPDDQRFVMFRAIEFGQLQTELIFVDNWLGEEGGI